MQILLENAGDAFINPTAELNVLTGTRKNITNSARNPENVAPTSSRLTGVSEDFVYEAPALSVTVLRIHTVQDSAVLAEPAAIAMSTPVGAAPELPETVEVTFADGSVGQKAVLWDHVEPTLYDWPGSYVIHGSIDGRADMVQLLLTVE